jgi:hypothetical protein
MRERLSLLYHYPDITSHVDMPTVSIAPDGTGSIYVPSQAAYEHLTPQAAPTGVVFVDGSFLVFKEIFRYDYPSPNARAPEICRLEYSYHYQRPDERFYLRFDFHPLVGDPATHPLHHVHVRGWSPDATTLPETPRLPTVPLMLEEILELLRVNFFQP